jgi:hypothetical protein
VDKNLVPKNGILDRPNDDPWKYFRETAQSPFLPLRPANPTDNELLIIQMFRFGNWGRSKVIGAETGIEEFLA